MPPPAPLFCPYVPPPFRPGDRVVCALRGPVVVTGWSTAPVRSPAGRGLPARPTPVVAAVLARAVRAEAAVAVAHWWGLSTNTVRTYRRALGVGPSTPGTRRVRQLNYREVVTPEVHARAVRAANTPEANARKGAARRGKPLPEALKPHFDRTGWVPSPETRARMSAANKARGRVPRGRGDRPWTAAEDALLDRLGPAEVAARTGRPVTAVYTRLRRLRRARGEPARPPAPPWTAGQLARLGTAPDADLAARFGRAENAVRLKRWRLKVPPFRPPA